MSKYLILVLPLFGLACAQQPLRQYQWTSLSEQGRIQNTVSVLKEDPYFENHRGFENLETQKKALSEKAPSSPQKIVLVGDTGCRLKESSFGDSYQNCKDGKDWIYESVVAQVAAEKPDLIVHMGDYHYREQCSEGKICRQYTDSIGYGWKTWEADFFAPSAKGFAVAPWMFVRGNHEDCQRAYEGYELLSEQNWGETCVGREKTEYISWGDVLIVQMDTAALPDKVLSAEEQKIWNQELKDIETKIMASPAKHVWLITHRPVVALVDNRRGGVETSNINLRKAFAQTKLGGRIELMIAGHIHNSQFLQADGFPTQLVVGHSGTALDDAKAFENKEKLLKTSLPGVRLREFFTDTKTGHSFGYAVLTRTAAGPWQIEFKDAQAQTTFKGPASRKAPKKF